MVVTSLLLVCIVGVLCLISYDIGRQFRPNEHERAQLVEAARRRADAEARNHLSEIACRLAEQNRPIPLCPECRELQRDKS